MFGKTKSYKMEKYFQKSIEIIWENDYNKNIKKIIFRKR